MRTKMSGIAALLGCVLFAGVVSAADLKVGIIDFQQVLMTSSAGKQAQTEIKARGDKLEADLKTRGQEIEGLKEKLEKEALVMSKEMREEKERDARIKIGDFKTLQKKYMEEFKVFEARLIQKIQKDIFDVAAEIGKKEGFQLILEKKEGGLIYAASGTDITDKAIQAYNAKFAAAGGKLNVE